MDTLLLLALSISFPSAAQADGRAEASSVSSRGAHVVRNESANSASVVLVLTNTGKASAILNPEIILPAGWNVVMGGMPFTLNAGESETWIVGIAIPAQEKAGTYLVKLSLRSPGNAGISLVSDSAAIIVRERRGLALTNLDRPLYAVAGSKYNVTFRLRNTGNTPAVVRLKATSSSRGKLEIPPLLDLEPSAAQTINIPLVAHDVRQSTDEVIDLSATQAGDTALSSASARVMIIPTPGAIERFSTLPATLRLRAGSASAGIAPIEIVSNSMVGRDAATRIALLARAGSGHASVFGERDEYRMEVESRHFSARAGDNYFTLSPLTSGGQAGIGAGAAVTAGAFGAQLFSQRFRTQANAAETGGSLSFVPRGQGRITELSLNAVTRTHANAGVARVASSAAQLSPLPGMQIDAEVARSSSGDSSGSAHSIRVAGGSKVKYDIAKTAGSPFFSGATRGSTNEYMALGIDPFARLRLNATLNRSKRTVSETAAGMQEFRSGVLSASFAGLVFVDYTRLQRNGPELHPTVRSRLQSISARIESAFGLASISAAFDKGRASSALEAYRSYRHVRLNTSLSTARFNGTVYSEFYNGASLSSPLEARRTVGANARFLLGDANSVTVSGLMAATQQPVSQHFSQFDAHAAHRLSAGSSIALRMRIASEPVGKNYNKTMYFEYSMPLRLPVGPARVPGMVRGTVRDKDTGKGIGGTIVKLGSAMSVTDNGGNVVFAGLKPGQYRVMLPDQAVAAATAYSGDQIVTIKSDGRSAPHFNVMVSRASAVVASVRQFSRARTSLEDAPDSLVLSGPVEGVMLSLRIAHDTIYRVTDSNGSARFEDLPDGRYTIEVHADAPTAFRYEQPARAIIAVAGMESSVEFRLIPRKKTVQIVVGRAL